MAKKRKKNNIGKRVSSVVRGTMRDVCYAIHSSGRQGFFSLKNGRYMPVKKLTFDAFSTSLQKWVYTHCALLHINGDDVIKSAGTFMRINQMRLADHFELSVPEIKAFADQQNGNHLAGTLSIAAMPGSPEPSQEAMFLILGIIRGDYDKKADGGIING